MKSLVAAFFVVGLALPATAAPAPTSGPFGLWRVADGTAVIRVKPCGKALCGFIAAVPPLAPGEKSPVGRKILINMRKDGDVWRGPIFNIQDGKNYRGEISVSGDHLRVKGCLSDGGVCGGETWRRQ
jgi:uncharacterized protein (DUF2147 family)